jgi:hypothetical protein
LRLVFAAEIDPHQVQLVAAIEMAQEQESEQAAAGAGG